MEACPAWAVAGDEHCQICLSRCAWDQEGARIGTSHWSDAQAGPVRPETFADLHLKCQHRMLLLGEA